MEMSIQEVFSNLKKGDDYFKGFKFDISDNIELLQKLLTKETKPATHLAILYADRT